MSYLRTGLGAAGDACFLGAGIPGLPGTIQGTYQEISATGDLVCMPLGSFAPGRVPESVLPPTTATLTNSSRPGQPFQSGDKFSLVITGAPGATVAGTLAGSTSSFGTTDGTGTLTILGTFGDGDVGSHQETWQAGGGSPASLNFTVAAAPAALVQSPHTMTSGGSNTPTYTPVASVSSGSFLTNDISIFGFNVPMWGLLAAGVAAVFLVPKK